MNGHKCLILLVYTALVVSTIRCQGVGVLEQLYETQQTIWCTFWKSIASLLRLEELMSCVSCAEDTSCSYIDSAYTAWIRIRDSTSERISLVIYSANRLFDGLIGLRMNELLSEFLLGCVLLCIIVFATYSRFWERCSTYGDVISSSYTVDSTDSPLTETLVACVNSRVTSNTVSERIPDDSDEAEFFEMTGSPCSTKTITESHSWTEQDNIIEEDTNVLENNNGKFFEMVESPCSTDTITENDPQKDQDSSIAEETNVLVKNDEETNDTPEVNLELHLDGMELPGGSDYVIGDSISLKSECFRPVRPAPPTVKVFSLHKPHEIPNDVMDSLLCLQKSCDHDHSKVRLIGHKVIVYSSLQYQTQLDKLRKNRADQRMAVSRALGLKVISDDLDDTTSTVSTQTDTIESPTTLVIKTEAFMRGEGDDIYTEFPKGSMTGTLLIAKDSFETKIIRGSWSQTRVAGKSSSTSLPNLRFSSVRENIAKSRIEIADFEGHLDGLNFEVGNFRSDNPFTDVQSSLSTSRPLDAPFERTSGSNPLKKAVATSSLNTIRCYKHQRSSSMFEPNSRTCASCVSQKHPYESNTKRKSLVEFSANISSMGSETSFYEKLSLLVAGYAFHKFSQSYSRSVPERSENEQPPPRMSRTL